MPIAAQHIKAARLHLQKCDPVMKRIIKQVGPCTLKTSRDRFLMLVRSIVSQQISTAAARTILNRLHELVAPDKISPATVAKYDIDDLRAVGISRQKAGYFIDLTEKVHSGQVELNNIGRKNNDEVIAELVQVKGIGQWTAQMFLMFSLGRLDVFPHGDLGIQNGIKKNYKTSDPPTKSEMIELAEPWQPYSTIASWYLWRSLEV